MLCGQTRILLKIKYIKKTFKQRIIHWLKYSYSKELRPFEKGKCHSCLWCDYFHDCKAELDWQLGQNWEQVSQTEFYYVGLPEQTYSPFDK